MEKAANPAPLGLMGFGMTTVLLNIHNAGFYPVSAMILAMGLCYGGAAQVIAGLLEYKKGNTFGATAFTSYGMFWIALVITLVGPKSGLIRSPFLPTQPMPADVAAILWLNSEYSFEMNVLFFRSESGGIARVRKPRDLRKRTVRF